MKYVNKSVVFIDVIILIFCSVLYLPFFDSFHIDIIKMLLESNNYGYYAYIFYGIDKINEIYSNNVNYEILSDVNYSDILSSKSDTVDLYDSQIESNIYTKDIGNELYKYMKVKVGKYNAHLLVIYDPSNVKVITSKKFNTGNNSGKESVLSMAKRYGAIAAINGGGFVDYGNGSDIPLGYVIKDGQLLFSNTKNKVEMIGFSNDNKLMLINATGKEAIEKGMRDGVYFSPFLIVNGVLQSSKSNLTKVTRAARTAIAQREDGIVLFLVTEGKHGDGPTLIEVRDFLKSYGAINAANLDGGGSTQFILNNKILNTPLNTAGYPVNDGLGRNVVTSFALIADEWEGA